MNKKILTLTLLTTLFVTQAQDAQATEKKMTGAERMKAMMAGQNKSPIKPSLPSANLGDQPKPVSDLKTSPTLSEGVSGPSIPVVQIASSGNQSPQSGPVSPHQKEAVSIISNGSAESKSAAEEQERLRKLLVEAEQRAREEREQMQRRIQSVTSEAELEKKGLEAQLKRLQELTVVESAAAKQREEEQDRSFKAQMEKVKQAAQESEDELKRDFERRIELALKEQNDMHLGVWNQIVAGLFTLDPSKKQLPETLGMLKFLLEEEKIFNESKTKHVILVFPKDFK